MDKHTLPQSIEKGAKKRMVTRNITIPLDFWETCKQKAGIRPLSAVIRKLLEGWLRGDFKID
jgi:predicted CopG family antitoxin